MPITMVTGLPGHGKTLYSLSRWKPEAEKEGRPVFHNNIPGLNIPGWQVWDVQKWEELPAGAILVVDEAQFAFPVTGRGQTPQWVQNLATHRHKGVDLVVITQDPMLVDPFVRRLVDRHFHVVRKFGTKWATIHEFANGVRDNVSKNRKDSIRHEWRYQKEVYSWYKSSELHTVKRRIPMRVWLGVGMIPLFLVFAGIAYYRLKPENAARLISGNSDQVETKQGTSLPGQSGVPPGRRDQALSPLEYAAAYQPRVSGLAHTAPVYDEVTKPVQAPYPAACVSMRSVCRCYTQQGTRLDTGDEICKQIVAGGFFVAWNQPVAQAVPTQAAIDSRGAQASQQLVQAAPVRIDGGTPVQKAHLEQYAANNPVVPPDEGTPVRVRPQR